NGWAHPSLRDTYESDRRPFVEHNLSRAIDPLGSRRPALAELQVDHAGRIAHAWLPGSETSTVDLIGAGLTLFTGGSSEWLRAAEDLEASVPLTGHELDCVTARDRSVRRRRTARAARRRTDRLVAHRPPRDRIT